MTHRSTIDRVDQAKYASSMSASTEMFADHRIVSALGAEESQAALGRVFLPVEFPSAHSTAPIGLELNALPVGRITVGFMSFHGAIRIQTAEPDNYHVDIPTHSRSIMRATRGQEVFGTDNTAGIFMPGRPVQLDCDDNFAQIALMIPSLQLQQEMENLLDTHDTPPLRFEAELNLLAGGGQTLLHALQLIDHASRDSRGLLSHPLAVHQLERVLLDTLLFSQPHNYSQALNAPTPEAGHTSVSRAVDLLRDDPARLWTIHDLASECATSERSLHLAFRTTLDTTPMNYLRRLRLERAREEILTAAPGTLTVTRVANKWGFLHLGRFSAAYAQRFSESPSDTMRSASKRGKLTPTQPTHRHMQNLD